jgi:hypothetical protein
MVTALTKATQIPAERCALTKENFTFYIVGVHDCQNTREYYGNDSRFSEFSFYDNYYYTAGGIDGPDNYSVVRSPFSIMKLTANSIETWSYNWSVLTFDKLSKQIRNLINWQMLRTHLLDRILIQKLGLSESCAGSLDFARAIFSFSLGKIDISEEVSKLGLLDGSDFTIHSMDIIINNSAPKIASDKDLFPSDELTSLKQQRMQRQQLQRSKIINFNYVLRNSYPSSPFDSAVTSSLYLEPLKLHGQQFKQMYLRKTRLYTQHRNAQLFYQALAKSVGPSKSLKPSSNNQPLVLTDVHLKAIIKVLSFSLSEEERMLLTHFF